VAKNKVDMSAFNKSMNSIEKAFIERLDKIEKAFKDTMKTMQSEALAAAPVDDGRLYSSIKTKEVSKLSYELRADAPYAAYVEFGTGKYYKSDYPGRNDEYFSGIASKFKKTGTGTTPSNPFFYPTVTKNIPKLKNKIKSILSKNA
jgi:HK97 gp10 family phage protein